MVSMVSPDVADRVGFSIFHTGPEGPVLEG